MTSMATTPERPASRLLRHWRALFHLAWPVALSRVGLVVMAMVNVVMVGRAGSTSELAALSLGYAVFMPPLVAGIGCMVGIVATTARAKGSGDPAMPEIALRGLRWALVVGAAAWLLLLPSGPLLRLIGHTPELVAGGGVRGADARPRRALPDRLRRGELLPRGHRPPAPRRGGDGGSQRPQPGARLAPDRRPPRHAGARRRRRGAGRQPRAPGDGGGSAGLDAAAARVRAICARRRCGSGGRAAGRRAPRCGGSASPAAPPTSSRPSPSRRSPRPPACSGRRRSPPTPSCTTSRRWSS